MKKSLVFVVAVAVVAALVPSPALAGGSNSGSLTPLSPGATCTTVTHQGSLAWMYVRGDDIWHVYIEPGQGNNIQDCTSDDPLIDHFICETLFCNVAESSGYDCKDEDLPIGHCVDFVVAQCESNETGIEMPFVWEIELVHTGPCT